MNKTILYLSSILLFFSCSNEKNQDFPFDNLDSAASGIHFSNNLVDSDSFNIMQYLYYYNGGGVAAGDLNNDGLVDLYFTGNQVNDALYINEGNLSFKDVSQTSGINTHNGWSTGVTMLDINSDGWLDIYVCRLGKYKIYNDHNRLYINNQDGTFTESSEKYGLAFSGFSTQAAFFDYDNDGDLDCYLLNHSVKRPDQFVNADRIRNEKDSLAGDRLYQNTDGQFTDVTESSGIYSSSVGFGLSVCIADINHDHWPDIYVGNDFHENDYLYLNNQDGTFTESIEKSIGHTSNFTMGSTLMDINNDAKWDIFSLDMLPYDETIYKKSGGWESKQIYDFKRSYKYHHQSPKNALQIYMRSAQSIPIYSEQASLFDLHASDWSWTPLVADFDQDYKKDIYITNGIYRRPNDMDFVNYFSEPTTKNKSDLEVIQKMPKGHIPNQYFIQENKKFKSISTNAPTVSNGACTADLDNDGDLDIIVNNINEEALIHINSTNPIQFLKIKLSGQKVQRLAKNGILFLPLEKESTQINTVLSAGNKGFQSMDESIAILPKSNGEMNLTIVWPDGYKTDVYIAPSTTFLELNDSYYEQRKKISYSGKTEALDSFFVHTENKYNDQDKEALLLYSLSQNGPKMTQSKEGNIFITQGKGKNGSILNPKTSRVATEIKKGSDTRYVDETDAVFFDADGDGDDDLYVCLGGNELPDGDLSLPDVLFINDNGEFNLNTKLIPRIPKNTSTVSASDYDNDGDIDLFVGVQSRAGDFSNPDHSYLLKNLDNRKFQAFQMDLKEIVFDSQWKDMDQDGRMDLVVVGHWMPITIFYNRIKGFERYEIPSSEGWWYSIEVDDFDKDGFLDIIAGNFGQNHRLHVDEQSPLKMYVNDFDKNRKNDPIISYQIEGKEYPYANLDLMVKQIPAKKKQTILHSEYATKTIQELFTPEDLNTSKIKTVNTLSSSVFYQNAFDEWERKSLPRDGQLSPIWAMTSHNEKYYIGGNHFDIDPNLGRQDALPLSIIEFNNRNISIVKDRTLPIIMGEVRSLQSIESGLLIGINDGPIIKLKSSTLFQK